MKRVYLNKKGHLCRLDLTTTDGFRMQRGWSRDTAKKINMIRTCYIFIFLGEGMNKQKTVKSERLYYLHHENSPMRDLHTFSPNR